MTKDLNYNDDDSGENMVHALRVTFREEAYELVAELESALLELEKDPDNMEQIGRAFRAMHTIKGSGGTCEFRELVAFTHELETIFDRVRSGKVKATHEIINLTLRACDQIKSLFDRYYQGGSCDEAKTASILASFRALAPGAGTRGKATPASAGEGTTQHVTYRIRFRPSAEVFVRGTDPINLLNELRELGMCEAVAQTDDVPYLEDIDPRRCYTHWDMILTTSRGVDAIQDVFIFLRDGSELNVDIIDEDGRLEDEKSYKRLAEILVERGDLTTDELQGVLKSKKLIGELLVEAGAVTPGHVESALVEQRHVRDLRAQRQGDDATSSIRVSTDKLDNLVNLVGELVTVQARLSQTALAAGIPSLHSIAEEVERLTASLRDNTMNIRMLPIGTMFSKFKRLVRDLSSELDKEIELKTDGAETELDKTVIERLGDPLLHLIRNSIDHGIEQPKDRVADGKPLSGTVHLSAKHSGAHVLVQIRDDGKGLDPAVVRAKAVEKGLISADAKLTEKELFSLIFAPGFSTAKKVTGLSGRGVGMDVVKRAIDSLRGSIELSSQKGSGTTITLKLPLTLAIIEGLLVKIGAESFIMPLSLVEECVELTHKDIQTANGRDLAHVRGKLVPFIRLREQFMIDGERPSIEQIVIVSIDEQRTGFVVDRVIGGHQTVIKNLGSVYKDLGGISGATILGDGAMALILDLPRLTAMAEREEAGKNC
jgi:two-component system chemotaxis sensor kinase CheA